MGIDEKSGQLIECVNPEHWKLGSIHYIQPDCVGKGASMDKFTIELEKNADLVDDWNFVVSQSGKVILQGFTKLKPFGEFLETFGLRPYLSESVKNRIEDRLRVDEGWPARNSDSDESWQASEALLKRDGILVNPMADPCDPDFNVDDDYASNP